jgi:hypothetical protein
MPPFYMPYLIIQLFPFQVISDADREIVLRGKVTIERIYCIFLFSHFVSDIIHYKRLNIQ